MSVLVCLKLTLGVTLYAMKLFMPLNLLFFSGCWTEHVKGYPFLFQTTLSPLSCNPNRSFTPFDCICRRVKRGRGEGDGELGLNIIMTTFSHLSCYQNRSFTPFDCICRRVKRGRGGEGRGGRRTWSEHNYDNIVATLLLPKHIFYLLWPYLGEGEKGDGRGGRRTWPEYMTTLSPLSCNQKI